MLYGREDKSINLDEIASIIHESCLARKITILGQITMEFIDKWLVAPDSHNK